MKLKMKLSKKTKIIFFTIIGILLILLILFIIRTVLSNKKKGGAVFYTANVETYENVIEISGTVSAAQEQTLQALSAGTVTAVYVKAGDHVKAGDVLIQLDDSEQLYQLEKQDYEMQTKKVSGSARELKLMETQLHALQQKVNDRKVVATFDGVIADFKVAVGDSLEAKDKVGTIVNVDYLTTEVEITETDVSKLKVGQTVLFTFSAYSKETVKGYVTSWPAIGEITSRGATIVKAKIRIDEYPEGILPNYSFTGKIEISPTEEYVVVERYAIGYEDKEAYVVLAKTGEKINVKVQPYGSDYVKVTEGLKGGEVLVQQSTPKVSGFNRNRNNRNSGGGGFPGGGGGGFSGGGAR
ncbi:MAG: efflux RND transporter periplasmic adaptor subunit [Spirochaetales bacterium]|nr:efflux RND transporter periplasmic adaptor subunit [Spirochaetales bacterium]